MPFTDVHLPGLTPRFQFREAIRLLSRQDLEQNAIYQGVEGFNNKVKFHFIMHSSSGGQELTDSKQLSDLEILPSFKQMFMIKKKRYNNWSTDYENAKQV